MESIAGIKECEEAEEGCALRTRDASVSILSESQSVSGIGPPDMCIVSKTSTSYYTSESQEATSFHYVLGLRIEHAGSLAAYFAKLTRNQVRYPGASCWPPSPSPSASPSASVLCGSL